MNVRVKAYAKLNLTLSVLGLSGGYHALESLVCSVDLFDLIDIKARTDNLVTVEMHGRGKDLPIERNNAVAAARGFIKEFATCGVDIVIHKNIPVGAGLGGSSADAAGVICGMSRLFKKGDKAQLKALADRYGSDTGYMLTGGYARLEGRGDIVTPINCKTRLNFLLLVPEGGVSTAQCFSLYDSSPEAPQSSQNAIQALISGDRRALANCLCNALYAPATRLNGNIITAFEELSALSPLAVNMTGSGSGVYALFENAEQAERAKNSYCGKFECIELKTI